MSCKVTISLPFYKRPERTKRAILSLWNQTMPLFEILATGDHCPFYMDIIEELVGTEIAITDQTVFGYNCNRNFQSKPAVYFHNLAKNYGGWGYEIRNRHILEASGEFFMFGGSDDVVQPNHVQNYLSYIDGTDYDFVYFNSFIEPENRIRDAQLVPGSIGHSELIVRTEFLRKMPPHHEFYGHDWKLIENMINAGARYKKAEGAPVTYIVKSIRGCEEKDID